MQEVRQILLVRAPDREECRVGFPALFALADVMLDTDERLIGRPGTAGHDPVDVAWKSLEELGADHLPFIRVEHGAEELEEGFALHRQRSFTSILAAVAPCYPPKIPRVRSMVSPRARSAARSFRRAS
jgi:hypothetical protein